MKPLAALALLLLPPQEDPVLRRARPLIQQLDADSPDEREAAEKALLEAGEAVEPLLKQAAEEGRPEIRARCRDLLEQIGLARKRRAFWAPARPVTLAFQEVPLKEALAALCKATGYAVTAGDVDPALPVTARIENASFLKALESICLSLNTWYRWNGAAIELGKARAAHSRAHAGPLLLSADLVRSREESGLALDLRLEWEPGLRVRWYEVEIDSAEDDKGGEVSVAAPRNAAGYAHRVVYSRAHALPSEGETRFSGSDQIGMTALSEGASRLGSVKGKITLFMPEEAVRVSFPKVQKPEPMPLGPVTATLRDFHYRKAGGNGWEASIDLDLTRLPSSKHRALFAYLLNSRIRFVDAEGKETPAENGGASSSGQLDDPLQRVGTTVRTDKIPESPGPKTVDVTLVTDVWSRTFPFELKDVPGPAGKK